MRVLAWCVMPNHWHFVALAARRRRPVGVHALVDGYAHATLARGTSHGRHGPAVPGPLQVVSRSRKTIIYGRCCAMWNEIRCGRIWSTRRRPGAGRVFGIACTATRPGCWTKVRCRCRDVGVSMCKNRRRMGITKFRSEVCLASANNVANRYSAVPSTPSVLGGHEGMGAGLSPSGVR